MAVNTKLLLPSSATQPKVGGDFTKKLKVKVIRLDKLLKGSVAIKKDELNESKREESEDRKEKIEEKLETKPGKEKEKITKKIKPKIGVFGFIKNFIGNILLGFFAVRLIDQLPKLVAIGSVVARAADFVIDVGGKLFDGLASFIDFGYKVSDGTKDILDNIGGDNAVALFEGLIDKVSFLIDALVLATVIGGKNVFDAFGLGPGGRLRSGLKKGVKAGGSSIIPSIPTTKPKVKARPRSIAKTAVASIGAAARTKELQKRIEDYNKRIRDDIKQQVKIVERKPGSPTPKRVYNKNVSILEAAETFKNKVLTGRISPADLGVLISDAENTIKVGDAASAVGASSQLVAIKEYAAEKGYKNIVERISNLGVQSITEAKNAKASRLYKRPSKFDKALPSKSGFQVPESELKGILPKGASRAASKLRYNLPKIGFGLDFLFAGIDFQQRISEGQSLLQAFSGAASAGVAGAVAGAKGGAAVGALGGSLFGPPGALIGGILGAIIFGTAGALAAGRISDVVTGVNRKNEGGPIRRAPEKVTTEKPKQISPPQPTRFDPDGDARITEMSKRLDKVDYFGPILGITGKILMGQSPDSQDYRNVGLGLSGFIQRASLLGLVQSINGYNQGGSVDFMSKLGQDITSWIADTFRSLITKPAMNVISFVRELFVTPIEKLLDGQMNDPSRSRNMFGFNPPSLPPLMAPPSISASASSNKIEYDLLQQDPEFAKEVYRLSKKYNINPSHLLGLIASESGFDPKADNGTHVGLIQFSKESAKLVGSSQAEILNMNRAQQMKLVEKYFDYWGLPKGAGPGQLYMSVFLPSYTNKASDYVVAKKGEAWYDDNVGLDVNQDGVITPSDLDGRVLKKMQEFGIPAGPSKNEEKQETSSDDKRHPGSITAGKLGKYLYQVLNSPKDFQAVTEHSEFGGVVGRHAENSYHYSDRAIDIGAYTWEQEKILNAIRKFNEINGVSPVELITGYDDPVGHSDHVHVAYQKGGFVPRNVSAFLHKGEIVVDADSAGPAKNMLLAINQAKDSKGVMKAIAEYAPYDMMSGETVIVDRKEIIDNTQPQPVQSAPIIMPVGGSDFFDSLDFVG